MMNWHDVGALLASGAQADPQDQKRQMLHMMGLLAIMGFMFYFAIFRPQQKKAKDHAALLKALKPGDKIVTTGGLLAIVISIKEKAVTVRSGDSKLEILKSAVGEVVERSESASQS